MATTATKVLIAEDEAEARLILSRYLSSKGYQIVEAADGYEALAAFDREQPEAILLDLMMPKLDGWEVLSYVRAQSSIPILVITARDATDDVVKALQMGADDYIVKPFKLREVEARLEAALRRHRPSQGAKLTLGPLEIDDQSKTVALHGRPVQLSPKEYELLKLLASKPGRVFSDREILQNVWPEGSLASSTDVKRYIHLLRRKLEEDPKRPKMIVTVKGFGYKLNI
jgi:DNA-binding response OmpR family regulator